MEANLNTIIISILTFVVGYVERKRSIAQKQEYTETKDFRTKQEERARVRQQEAQLSMKMAVTTSELSDVIAHAISGGKVNGNVTKARCSAQKAREDYEEFVQHEACVQITKY